MRVNRRPAPLSIHMGPSVMQDRGSSIREVPTVRRLIVSALVAVFGLLAATPAFAHQGGHKGGCEDFGHVNRAIAQDPASFGFPDARNLGDIVSGFAHEADGQPGVSDIVENVDHLACG